MAGHGTDQPRSLHFLCLQLPAEIPEFYNIPSCTQVNTYNAREAGRGGGEQARKRGCDRHSVRQAGVRGTVTDTHNDGRVTPFSSSRGPMGLKRGRGQGKTALPQPHRRNTGLHLSLIWG